MSMALPSMPPIVGYSVRIKTQLHYISVALVVTTKASQTPS